MIGMTGQDIIDKARLILGDKDKRYWSDEELTRYLDDGVRELAKRSGIFQRKTLLEVKQTQPVYTIDDEVLKILEAYDETNGVSLILKPYSVKAEKTRDWRTVLIADFKKLIFPVPEERLVTVLYSYIPKSFGDGIVVFDFDEDSNDDTVTYDFDGDGQQDIVYWKVDGSPAGVLPEWAQDVLVDYVVYEAYMVDRAEQNQQKAQFHYLRFKSNANRLADLAFQSYGAGAEIAYQGF